MTRQDNLKKWILRLSSVLLPLSVAWAIIGSTLLFVFDLRIPRFSLSAVSIVCGALLWYTGFVLKKNSRFIFSAVCLLLTGCLFLSVDFGLLSSPFNAVWPFFMLFISVAFLVSGLIHYSGKPHAVFVVPAVAFSCLGLLFFLFSTDIIVFSFTKTMLWTFPLFLLPLLVLFIIWLFRKRKNGADPDDKDGDE